MMIVLFCLVFMMIVFYDDCLVFMMIVLFCLVFMMIVLSL